MKLNARKLLYCSPVTHMFLPMCSWKMYLSKKSSAKNNVIYFIFFNCIIFPHYPLFLYITLACNFLDAAKVMGIKHVLILLGLRE
uniref:Uncharacterized protein n=1 Tax=Rhizophora mucronata TaxID=61149 RepID=A0A2P2PHA9_RHIMU